MSKANRDHKNRLPKMIRQALDETNLPWTTHLGAKHLQVFLQGQLVATLPVSGVVRERDPSFRGTLSRIRRFGKTHQAAPQEHPS